MSCDFTGLWQEHKEALYYFILKRVPDSATAQDISQEVLLKVYRYCQNKSGVRNVRSWLFQIARNTIVDHYRRQKPSISIVDGAELEQKSENSSFKEAVEFLLPMIQLLPSLYAVPLRMSEVDGVNLKDIASELNIGLSAVKQRISRGKKMLKEIFIECCLMEVDGRGRLVSFDIRPDCASLQRYRSTLKKVY